jgi:hypothetical protein
MEAATYWFDATDEEGESLGYYAPKGLFNSAIVKVGEDGKLRIGVKKDVVITSDWAIFDNFRLHFYGNLDPTGIHDITAKPVANQHIYSIDGRIISTGTNSTEGLKPGLYIIGNKKIIVK